MTSAIEDIYNLVGIPPVPSNPVCSHCHLGCGGVCRITNPVICNSNHINSESKCPTVETYYADNEDVVNYISDADLDYLACPQCGGRVGHLPEPEDPDFGALYGVVSYLGGMEMKYADSTVVETSIGVWMATGRGACMAKEGDGEFAFRMVTGEF